MRVLGSAVLVMEFFVMGFAVLLAKDNGEPSSVIAGLILALLFLLTPGILKKKSGWFFGSLLQIPMIAYAVVVPSMAIVGPIFAGLWVAAIVIGRKGEAIRAKLLAESDGAQGS
jgi:hypothetical protein